MGFPASGVSSKAHLPVQLFNSPYQRKPVNASDTAQSLRAKAPSFAVSDTKDGATGPLSSNIPFGP